MSKFYNVEWAKTFMFPDMYPGDMMVCPNTPWVSLEDWDKENYSKMTKLKFRPVIIIGRDNERITEDDTFVEYTILSSSVGLLRSACRIRKT